MDRSSYKEICQICGKKFKTKKSLKDHENTHTKPFKCVTCGSGFASKAQLQTHEYLHTGETPFPCSKCSMRFRAAKTRNNHERSLHKYRRGKDNNQKQAQTSPDLPSRQKAAPGPSRAPPPPVSKATPGRAPATISVTKATPCPSRAPSATVPVSKGASRPPQTGASKPVASTSATAVCYGAGAASKPAFLSAGKAPPRERATVKRRSRRTKKKVAVVADSSSDPESDTASQDEQDYVGTYGLNFRRFWKKSEVPLCIIGQATVNKRKLYLVRLKLESEPNVGDPFVGLTNGNIAFVYAEKFKKWFPQLVIQHLQGSLVLVDMPDEGKDKDKAKEGSDSGRNDPRQADKENDDGAEEVGKKIKLDHVGLPILDDIHDPEDVLDFSDSSDDGIELLANLWVEPREDGKRQSDFIVKIKEEPTDDFWD